jgi:hypothetical protein
LVNLFFRERVSGEFSQFILISTFIANHKIIKNNTISKYSVLD